MTEEIQIEALNDALGRAMYDFMKMLDERQAILADVLHTEMIELSTSRSPLASESEGTKSLGVYVDVAVSRNDDHNSHNLIRQIISSEPITLDLEDNREATLNYFLVNPDIYSPVNGKYEIRILDEMPIVLSSFDDASLFEHDPLPIETLSERKKDGVLSVETFNAIKNGDILTFPALILITL